jgi:GNAT superfamily N-acetyltransferase
VATPFIARPGNDEPHGQRSRVIVIREATPADVVTLAEMRLALEGHTSAPSDPAFRTAVTEWFAAHVGNPSFVGWIVEDRGHPVAVGGLVLISRPPYTGNPSGTEGLVTSMYTVPERRGEGLGGQLLQAMMRDARRRGVGRLVLYSSSGARSLYERFGFTADTDRGSVLSRWLDDAGPGDATA